LIRKPEIDKKIGEQQKIILARKKWSECPQSRHLYSFFFDKIVTIFVL